MHKYGVNLGPRVRAAVRAFPPINRSARAVDKRRGGGKAARRIGAESADDNIADGHHLAGIDPRNDSRNREESPHSFERPAHRFPAKLMLLIEGKTDREETIAPSRPPRHRDIDRIDEVRIANSRAAERERSSETAGRD